MGAPELPRPRPRFVLESDLDPEEVVQRTKRFLVRSDHIKGVALKERLELAFTRDQQHLWSPQLIVDVTPSDVGTRMSARFGPHPHVWGMYTAIYFALAILSLIALAFGVSQWTIGQPPTAFWVVPAALVLSGFVYGASFIGQGLGFEQMYELRKTLTELTEAREIGRSSRAE